MSDNKGVIIKTDKRALLQYVYLRVEVITVNVTGKSTN